MTPEVQAALQADLAFLCDHFAVDRVPLPAIILDSDAVVAASAVACPGNKAMSAFSNFSQPVTLSAFGTAYQFPAGPTCYFRTLWSPTDSEDRKKSKHELTHYVLSCGMNPPMKDQEQIAISMEEL